MNDEMASKLEQLKLVYRDLTSCYREIAEYGHEEVIMIDQGDMEALLGLLRDKEVIMAKVAGHQEEIDGLQQKITDSYQLEFFSLKKLSTIIGGGKQKFVTALQNEIRELIKQLEILEEQETIHERMLRSYTTRLQSSTEVKQRRDAAKRAYEKMFTGDDPDSQA